MLEPGGGASTVSLAVIVSFFISTQYLLSVSMLMFQVAHFKDYIPQAFPGGHSMILDAEVLLIDTKTSKPLPFGTLGVHKVDNTNSQFDLMCVCHTASFFNAHCCSLPSESRLSRRQRVPFCFRLYLLQRCESHGEVMCFHPAHCVKSVNAKTLCYLLCVFMFYFHLS